MHADKARPASSAAKLRKEKKRFIFHPVQLVKSAIWRTIPIVYFEYPCSLNCPASRVAQACRMPHHIR